LGEKAGVKGRDNMKYKVHTFELSMTDDLEKLQDFLNSLTGEVISVFPNVNTSFFSHQTGVDFVVIVEKLK
jgi:hypothetical protein